MLPSDDLSYLLAHMSPALHSRGYRFRCLPEEEALPWMTQSLGWFREEEGITLILPAPAGEEEWACITLSVYSSLTAVGFLALIARHLAEADIPLNVVSAVHHDHLFVPWERRTQTLQVLENVIRQALHTSGKGSTHRPDC